MNDLIFASIAYASGSPHAATFLTPPASRRNEDQQGPCLDRRPLFRWLIPLGLRKRPLDRQPAGQPVPA